MSYLSDPKDPSEIIAVAFDFTGKANTLSNATFTIGLRWGSDTAVTLAKSGTASISGAVVTQKFSGGANLNDYDVKCVVDDSDGEKLAAGWTIAVRSKPL